MADDTTSTVGPTCPYCNTTRPADGPEYYDASAYTDDTCMACGKRFAVTVEHHTSWVCEGIEDEDD